MRDFRKIMVWQKAMDLVKAVYGLLSYLPKEEQFALASQMRRAAVSIPSNIAEGASRTSEKDFKRFLQISLGSAFELETQLLLSYDLGYIKNENKVDVLNSIQEVQKMLNGFINKLTITRSTLKT